MAKDPATLWYWNDFLTGTMTFTRHQIGCYIHLLGAQFNCGHLSIAEIKNVLREDFNEQWPFLQKKFIQDDKGLFFNQKAEDTKSKRASYTASRRANMGQHMGSHMENEIENRKLKFINEVEKYRADFSEALVIDFCSYWLEMNKSSTKYRYEDQKFFDYKKRMTTFLRNDKSGKYTHAAATKNVADNGNNGSFYGD